MSKEKEIEKYMQKLGISYAEAVQLMEDDADDFIGEEGEEMTEKAKVNSAKERAPREKNKNKKPRERKVDEEKGYLLRTIDGLIRGLGAENTNLKTETELSFDYNDNKYTLKLTKHRPQKEEKGGKK